jgi:hypothetical protein
MQLSFVQQFGVALREYNLRTEVMPARVCDRFLEIFSRQFGLTTQCRRSQSVHYAHVCVDATVNFVATYVQIMVKQGLNERKLGNGVPTCTPRTLIGQ